MKVSGGAEAWIERAEDNDWSSKNIEGGGEGAAVRSSRDSQSKQRIDSFATTLFLSFQMLNILTLALVVRSNKGLTWEENPKMRSLV